MARPLSFLSYERRIIGTALLAVVPLAGAAALLVWTGDYPAIVSWTAGVLIAATLGVATFALHEVIAYPLRTLSNLVSAVREEDYSVRARDLEGGETFAEVLAELNELSAAMRDRRLAAIEAAALVRAVIAEVDAAIFTFDSSSRLELVNRAGERLLDDVPERLLGRTAEDLGLADLLESAEAITVERSFGGPSSRWSVRVSTFRREGEVHRLLVVADISRALRQEEIHAWQRLVRVLGHELNNSLAPIKSIAGSLEEALTSRPLDERVQTDLASGLGIISRRADGLARFLSSYSALARLPEPARREVELAAVVRRAVTLETRMEVVVEDGLEVTLHADEDQLEQVIINLVKNAVDAALETGGGVTVSWKPTGSAAVVVVADEGPGIASTANLFVPFFTTKPGGSGIGLVLSRQIAEAHGGSLVLRNRHDRKGCEAVLRLPV